MILWGLAGVIVLCASSSGELYSAVSDLEKLLDTEAMIIQTFQVYFEKVEERLNLLKRVITEYKKDHLKRYEDSKEHWVNPISAYLLIKRVFVDWKQYETAISFEDLTKDVFSILSTLKKDYIYPSEVDLSGAAAGVIRAQDVYGFDCTSLAKGEINGQQYATKLSARDCYDLGLHSYSTHDFHHTKLWMLEALRISQEEGQRSLISQWEIREYLSFAYYKEGNLQEALRLTEEWLKLIPGHQRAVTNKLYYVEAIKNGTSLESKIDGDTQNTPIQPTENYLYKMTCRKAISPPVNLLSKLHCYYARENHPFLILAPLKLEEAYLNPKVLLFRELISDSEIAIIKEMATSRLERATVENGTYGGTVSTVRVSKFGWLKKEEHPAVQNLYQRVEDMTSLSTETAEQLQVLNYGISGHYDVHEDYARDESKSTITKVGTGNREATVLFYLSDVAEGGATVFPNLRLGVWPEKGTALFWMNLLPNGQGDTNSRHAACPVLVGSKWVATVWLHEKGQKCKRQILPRAA